MQSQQKMTKTGFPAKIAAIYLLIGGLWILFSDALLGAVVSDPTMIVRLSIYKGWFYVVITALLLFWMVRRHLSESGIAHRALQEQVQNNRLLFDLSPIGLLLCRMDGTILEANLAYAAIIGRTVAETQKLSFWEIAPQQYAGQERIMRELLEKTGRYGPWEKEYRHKNGTLVPVRLSGRIIERNGERLIWSSVEDITDRKRAEEALTASEERFRRLAENARDMIYRMSLPDGRYEYVSPAAATLFGYTPEEFYASPQLIREAIHPDWRRYFEAAWERLLTGEVPPTYEYRIIHRSGETRWMNQRNILVRDQGGRPVAIEGIVTDITARRETEEELKGLTATLEKRVTERTAEYAESQAALLNLVDDLNQKSGELAAANLKLEELDRLKSMFIASMSHELRTPLNSIIGFTGIILMGMSGEISAIQKKQLGMIKSSANHLLALINDVIDVSKIEAGRVELAFEPFDLSALAIEVKESFAVAAAGKGLKLECITGGRLEVASDRRRVQQILINLVGNAIKFTEKGAVAVAVSETETGASISVRDTGVGIRGAETERLFNAFSRIQIQGHPVVEGTGLGLYLSRRIARLLGGEITVTSEFGRGSEFTLSLPRVCREEKA